MTEDEAKTKWCPHTVASHTDPRQRVGYSRDEIGLPADTWTHACIGSACMAWRQGARQLFRNSATGALTERDLTGNGQWVYVDGFCGLAGSPQ